MYVRVCTCIYVCVYLYERVLEGLVGEPADGGGGHLVQHARAQAAQEAGCTPRRPHNPRRPHQPARATSLLQAGTVASVHKHEEKGRPKVAALRYFFFLEILDLKETLKYESKNKSSNAPKRTSKINIHSTDITIIFSAVKINKMCDLCIEERLADVERRGGGGGERAGQRAGQRVCGRAVAPHRVQHALAPLVRHQVHRLHATNTVHYVRYLFLKHG